MGIPVRVILSRKFVKSLVFGFLRRKEFINLEKFCIFIGYQRSGHSFIGALLDAHSEVAIGMEVDVLNLVQQGYSKNQILFILTYNSWLFANKLNNVWTEYSYAVPGQYQGRYKLLKLVGDKKGGKSTLWLGEDPTLLEKLKQKLELQIKILHVIRNPFDNIATMAIRHLPEDGNLSRDLLLEKITLYFHKVRINKELKEKYNSEILDIYHEDFIQDSEKTLEKILNFLDLPRSKDYINDCKKIIYTSPHKSRFDIDWPQDLKEKIQSEISSYNFLKRYSYDD